VRRPDWLEIVMAVGQSLPSHRQPVGKRITTAIVLADDPTWTLPAVSCDRVRPAAGGHAPTETPARVSVRATLQKAEGSGSHEPRRVLSLVDSDNAGPCVAEVPVRADTVRAVEPGPGQRFSDPAADFGLSRRLGSKQHP
jgi:hypothetical protein